ncbi:MAG: hypothetical protein OXG44_03405 [Gammaproteobacteria bacterium]|nr:hypothetical protein [Gammaproteobacteria bacterium]
MIPADTCSKSHLEQEQDDPDLCRNGQKRRCLQGLERQDVDQTQIAQNDPDQQFAEHRWLVHPLGQLSAQLRGHQNGRESQQEERHVAGGHAVRPMLSGGHRPCAEDAGRDDPAAPHCPPVPPLPFQPHGDLLGRRLAANRAWGMPVAGQAGS